jgi:hypothetical protein
MTKGEQMEHDYLYQHIPQETGRCLLYYILSLLQLDKLDSLYWGRIAFFYSANY